LIICAAALSSGCTADPPVSLSKPGMTAAGFEQDRTICIQRRAHGLADENYLRLKILTCMLPPL
jgi:hypothetical protein